MSLLHAPLPIKISYKGDLRRITVPDRSTLSLHQLVNLICSHVTLHKNFCLKYKDEEGDFINVSTELDLAEAIRQFEAKKLHCLIVEDIVSVNDIPPTSSEAKPQSSQVVHQALCNSCGSQIHGLRYKCVVCVEFDLCEACEATENNHPIDHPLMKIKVPLPPTFQGIHAVSAGLHQCRGHLTKVFDQSSPQIYTTAEAAKQNLAVLKDQFAYQLLVLSDQIVSGATQLKDVVLGKYEEVKSSDFLGEVSSALNAAGQQAQNVQQRFQQYVQQPTSSAPPAQQQTQIPTPQTQIPTPQPQTQIPQTQIPQPQPQTSQNHSQPSTEDIYKDQLKNLFDMGFCDEKKES